MIEREDGVIELRPQLAVPTDQAWFWTPSWQRGEKRVDELIAAGDVEVSVDSDEFIRDLDRVRKSRGRPKQR